MVTVYLKDGRTVKVVDAGDARGESDNFPASTNQEYWLICRAGDTEIARFRWPEVIGWEK